jgi:hypothetical protein
MVSDQMLCKSKARSFSSLQLDLSAGNPGRSCAVPDLWVGTQVFRENIRASAPGLVYNGTVTWVLSG